MTKPLVSRFEVADGANELINISRDGDADPGVLSYILDQQGGSDYIYVTLDGLRALVAAAEQLQEAGDEPV
tara:strand:+ start:1611 stop:1823 length:213 start_codon:yes stop_codon:yes gene_type:complete